MEKNNWRLIRFDKNATSISGDGKPLSVEGITIKESPTPDGFWEEIFNSDKSKYVYAVYNGAGVGEQVGSFNDSRIYINKALNVYNALKSFEQAKSENL